MSDSKTEELMDSILKNDEDKIKKNLRDILKRKAKERLLSELEK